MIRELNKNIQIKESIENSFRASQQQRQTLIMVLQRLYMTMQAQLQEALMKSVSEEFEPSPKELRVVGGMLKMGSSSIHEQKSSKNSTDLKQVLLDHIHIRASKMRESKEVQTDSLIIKPAQPEPLPLASQSRDKKQNFEKYVKNILSESRVRKQSTNRNSTSNSHNYSRGSLAQHDTKPQRPHTSVPSKRPSSQQPHSSTTLLMPRPASKLTTDSIRRPAADRMPRTSPKVYTSSHTNIHGAPATTAGYKPRSASRKTAQSAKSNRVVEKLAADANRYDGIAATGADHLSRAERLLEKMLGKEKSHAQSGKTLESYQSSDLVNIKQAISEPCASDEPRLRTSNKPSITTGPVAFSFSGSDLRASAGFVDAKSPKNAGAGMSKVGPGSKSKTIGSGIPTSASSSNRRLFPGSVAYQASSNLKPDIVAALIPTSPKEFSSPGTSFFSTRRKSNIVVKSQKIAAVASGLPQLQQQTAEGQLTNSPNSPNRLFGRLDELSAIQNFLEEPTEEDFGISPVPAVDGKQPAPHELSQISDFKGEVDERTSHNLKQLARIFQKESFGTDPDQKISCERKLNFESVDVKRSGTPYLDILKGSIAPVEVHINLTDFTKPKGEPSNLDLSRSKMSVLSQASQTPSNQARIDQANKRLSQARDSSQGRLGSPISRTSSRQIGSPSHSEREVPASFNLSAGTEQRGGTADSLPFCIPPNRPEWDSSKKPFTDFLAQDPTALLKLSRSFEVESGTGALRDSAAAARFSRNTIRYTEGSGEGIEAVATKQNGTRENQRLPVSVDHFLAGTWQQAANPFRGLLSPK